jgi:hypothetical protein
MSEQSPDFRDWDLPEQRFESGTDQNGYPFVVWRERADNRWGVGVCRPRYCCITPRDGQLMFTMFDPSRDLESTGAPQLFIGLVTVIAVLLSVVILVHDKSIEPGHLFGNVLLGLFIGGPVAGVWYWVVTTRRWYRHRLKNDGRYILRPWAALEAFQVVSAHDLNGGTDKDGNPLPGNGLVATFGTLAPQLGLTANRWSHNAIAELHRLLRSGFMDQRSKHLAAWQEAQRKAQSAGRAAVSEVPTTLG